MILTLTPNPSIDATLSLSGTLIPGTVNRASDVTRVAGGKGINVSHAVHLAGNQTMALFPAAASDHFMTLIEESGIPHVAVHMDSAVRTNTTLTDPAGQTTKANGPGPELSAAAQELLLAQLAHHAATASWVVLAGSLPGGVPESWYSTLIGTVQQANPRAQVAVDTSDKFLRCLKERLHLATPTLLKPNGFELGQLVGRDGYQLEREAEAGDFSGVVAAAREINSWGISQVLVTLGAAGAVLVTAQGAWRAIPPPGVVVSTVGAGDCALAGFLMANTQANTQAAAPAECLRQAVAYGTAAAGLPGTMIPTPDQINLAATAVVEL